MRQQMTRVKPPFFLKPVLLASYSRFLLRVVAANVEPTLWTRRTGRRAAECPQSAATPRAPACLLRNPRRATGTRPAAIARDRPRRAQGGVARAGTTPPRDRQSVGERPRSSESPRVS